MEFKKASEILATREKVAAEADAQRVKISTRAANAAIDILSTQSKDTAFYQGRMHVLVRQRLQDAGYYVKVEADPQNGYEYTYVSLYESFPSPSQAFSI